jgi:prepilin-type N-terminal cleavage/methylation domain-containing protein
MISTELMDRARRGRRGGFTIIEILVVVAIIVILVAVVIAVGSSVKSSSQRNQTKVTLKAIKAIYDGYVQETGTTSTTVPGFMTVAVNMPSLGNAIKAMPASAVSVGTGTVYDGFGNPIVLGSSTAKGTFFQSYGPDGTASADDMFSYDP